MPFRVFGYDGAEYVKQSRRENRNEIKYPVITLVLYLGFDRKWEYPKTLFEILDIEENIKPYVNDFKINLFEIAYLDREKIDLFKSDFKIPADYLYQMRVNRDYIPDKTVIDHVEELLMLMAAMTGDGRFEETINDLNGKERVTMCEVLDRVEAKGIEKGADIISKLNEILVKEGDLEKILKANTNKEYRNELLKKYNLMDEFKN